MKIRLQNLESSQNNTGDNQKKQNLKVCPMLLLQQPIDSERNNQRQHIRKDLVEGILDLDGLDDFFALDHDLLGDLERSLHSRQNTRDKTTHDEQSSCAGHVGDTGDSAAADLPYKTKTLLVAKPEAREHEEEPEKTKEQHEPGTTGIALEGKRRRKHGEDRLHQNSHNGVADTSACCSPASTGLSEK